MRSPLPTPGHLAASRGAPSPAASSPGAPSPGESAAASAPTSSAGSASNVDRNIVWHHGEITPAGRQKALGQRGVTLWFTGLSGSGKSTIAARVESLLVAEGRHAYLLDGDNLRHGLCRDLGFSAEDRSENIRRIGEVAKLFTDAATIVLCAFVSPYQRDRQAVRALMAEGEFVEVFVDTPLDICAARDPKGLYQRAMAGEIQNFTGVSAPYEAPEAPDIHLATEHQTVEQCADNVLAYLRGTDRLHVKASRPA